LAGAVGEDRSVDIDGVVEKAEVASVKDGAVRVGEISV
jgi:hypothetical protein